MKLAEKGIIPELDNYKPLARNKYGETVAILLAQKEIIPPKCWMHDINIQDKYGLSIKTILQNRQLPVPQHWQNEEEMTIFDQACFRIIPDITGHKSDEQNEDGFTVAMILTINNINIPVEWQHDPNIRNKYGYTVAFIQAKAGKIPDEQWQHDKYLRCYYGNKQYFTVQNILQSKNIEVPEEWRYVPLDKDEDNQVIISLYKGIIPKLEDNNPKYQNIDGYTVAMKLALRGIIPPREWMHDFSIKNYIQSSLITYLQMKQLPVPQHWQNEEEMTIFDQACFKIIPSIEGHKPEEQDEYGFTVAMILAINKIQIPEEWKYDKVIKNKYGQTLQDIQLKIDQEIKKEQKFTFEEQCIFNTQKLLKQPQELIQEK